MGELKAGSIDDMANSMAEAIDNAMKAAWPAANNGQSLPDQGRRDRQVLFVAIANGVLGYLQSHLAALETTTVQDQPGGHRHHLDFNL